MILFLCVFNETTNLETVEKSMRKSCQSALSLNTRVRFVLQRATIGVMAGTTVLALSCSNQNSNSSLESTISESARALFDVYSLASTSKEFLSSLDAALNNETTSLSETLPKVGKVGDFVFNDFDQRVKSLATKQPYKFKGNLRKLLSLGNQTSARITVQDFQLAENYIADNLKAVENSAAKQTLAKKYTPQEILRATHAAAVISALPQSSSARVNAALNLTPGKDVGAAAKGIGEGVGAAGSGVQKAAKGVGAATVCGNLVGYGCGKAGQGFADRINDFNNQNGQQNQCKDNSKPSEACTYEVARRAGNGEIIGEAPCGWVKYKCECNETYTKVGEGADETWKHKDKETSGCHAQKDPSSQPATLQEPNSTAVINLCKEMNNIMSNCTGG